MDAPGNNRETESRRTGPATPRKLTAASHVPRLPELLSRRSLEEYKRVALADDEDEIAAEVEEEDKKDSGGDSKQEPAEQVAVDSNSSRMSITEIISDFLERNPEGATLISIADHLRKRWNGIGAAREHRYGQGSIKRIALGALNEGKMFRMAANPSGVKMWRLDPTAVRATEKTTKSPPPRKSRRAKKVQPGALQFKVAFPRAGPDRAKFREVLTLLEAVYEKLGPQIGPVLSQANVWRDA